MNETILPVDFERAPCLSMQFPPKCLRFSVATLQQFKAGMMSLGLQIASLLRIVADSMNCGAPGSLSCTVKQSPSLI